MNNWCKNWAFQYWTLPQNNSKDIIVASQTPQTLSYQHTNMHLDNTSLYRTLSHTHTVHSLLEKAFQLSPLWSDHRGWTKRRETFYRSFPSDAAFGLLCSSLPAQCPLLYIHHFYSDSTVDVLCLAVVVETEVEVHSYGGKSWVVKTSCDQFGSETNEEEVQQSKSLRDFTLSMCVCYRSADTWSDIYPPFYLWKRVFLSHSKADVNPDVILTPSKLMIKYIFLVIGVFFS